MKSTPYEEGNPGSKILVLGEAPARVEMRLGRPLVGPSGDVFNDCLHTAGLKRSDCYILNVWEDMVSKDKLGTMYDSMKQPLYTKRGFTEYGLGEAQKTLERIEKSGCNVILTLGEVGLTLLSGSKKPMLKWRGSPMWSTLTKRKFIPTIHPAATLHGVYIWRYLIINDMKKLQRHSAEPRLRLPARELIVQPSLSDVLGYMDNCLLAGRVATDLEVINHQISCFSLSYKKEEAMTVPLTAEGGGDYWSQEDEETVWLAYAKLMGNTRIAKINQNLIGFDCPFLLSQCHIHTHGPVYDTMIAQHCMYPEFPKGLDFIASVHTDEPYWKDDGKIWKNPKIDWATFQRYCGRDACVALEAWDVLSGEMTAGDYWPTYDMTARLREPLAYMTVRGLLADRDGMEHTKLLLEKAIDKLEQELAAVAVVEFNCNSPKQCNEYFYEILKIKPYVNAEGNPTTDDKALSRIARSAKKGAKEAKIVQKIRNLKKLKNTYVEVTLDKDSRLRCSWNPRGTWTGRLSSSQTLFGTGMNLQNLDPRFKGFIVAG